MNIPYEHDSAYMVYIPYEHDSAYMVYEHLGKVLPLHIKELVDETRSVITWREQVVRVIALSGQLQGNSCQRNYILI